MLGLVRWDDPEGRHGEGGGGEFRMGPGPGRVSPGQDYPYTGQCRSFWAVEYTGPHLEPEPQESGHSPQQREAGGGLQGKARLLQDLAFQGHKEGNRH